METLFLYFGKVILCSGVMFLYYRLFLKDKTFHHYNRFYLLSVLIISLLLPLLNISYFTLEVNNDIYIIISKLQNFNSTKTLDNDFFYFKLIAFVIGLVSLLFLIKLILGLIKIERLKKQFSKENFQGINFYQTDLQDAPFSFFRNLFWKNSILINSDLGKQILKHEMVHIEQKHSWDKIFIEIFTSVFWFNPVFYFIRKEINLIHEYLADKKAIKNSDTKAFAQMLLASHFSGKQLPATSPFLSSNLKKRLTILKTPKTKYSYARRIFALPILFILAFIYLVNAKNKEIKITNIEISKIVSEIKKDTLVPKNQITEEPVSQGNYAPKIENTETANLPKDAIVETDGTKIYQANPELFVNNDKIDEEEVKKLRKEIDDKRKANEPFRNIINKKNTEASKLSNELRTKSDELRKLSLNKDFDNPKFSQLEKQMDELGAKIDLIFNSDEFKNNIKQLDLNFEEIDKLYAKVDKYYNSEEYLKKIKDSENRAIEAEKRINSPEFQKKIKDAEKRALEAEKRINSPEFQKKIKDAEKRALEAEKRINSPEFQKRSKVIVMNSSSPDKIYFNSNDIMGSNIPSNANIYIDGKLSTKEDLKSLKSKDIQNVNIYQNKNNDKEISEIKIQTKK